MKRLRSCGFLVPLSLLAGFAWAAAPPESPRMGPAGSAFWDTVPTSVPAGAQRGDVLWVRERDDAPAGSRGWSMIYVTEGATGALEYASGELYLPTASSPAPRRLLIWGTGTAGFQDSCAPSRTPLQRPDRSTRVPAITELLTRGYAVTMSDYQGLGVPGPTAYLNGPAQGKASLDAARAARRIAGNAIGTDVALYGFSQGGQTVLWAAHLAQRYAPELRVHGIVPIAPAARHLDLSFYDLGIRENGGYFIARMAGLQVGHPGLRLRDILTEAGLEALPMMSAGCYEIFGTAAAMKEPYAKRQALEPGQPWRKRLEENDRFLPLPAAIPVLLVQGDKDIAVPVEQIRELRNDLCAQRMSVDYRELPGVDHLQVVPPAAALLADWFDARFAGRPAQSNCR